MLTGAAPAAVDEDPLVDAVRLLASPEGAPHAGRAARLTGLAEDELRELVLAYRHGGTGGVAAAAAASKCPAAQMAGTRSPSAGHHCRPGDSNHAIAYTIPRQQWRHRLPARPARTYQVRHQRFDNTSCETTFRVPKEQLPPGLVPYRRRGLTWPLAAAAGRRHVHTRIDSAGL
jgi:hypothetical protein